MDGHFVRNLSIGIPVLESVRKITKLPLDAHLMISDPSATSKPLSRPARTRFRSTARSGRLTAMAERIRDLGARASVAVNPETHADRVLEVAEHLDMILVMSVHPGFGGQGFIPATLDKLRHIRRELTGADFSIDVEVDGGIKVDNIARSKAAGANVFVSGSEIFGHGITAKLSPTCAIVFAHSKQLRSARSDTHFYWLAGGYIAVVLQVANEIRGVAQPG